LADLAALDEKIRTAISSGREDLAKAGVSRQIDLESQIAAIDKALADVEVNVEEGQKALQAVLATRREAQSRLDDFKRSEPDLVKETARGLRARPKADVEKASAIVSRMTGVVIAVSEIGLELDELDRLHRERAIEARLARFKSDH
jgi:DNA-binding transcriptional ArsR family regulator